MAATSLLTANRRERPRTRRAAMTAAPVSTTISFRRAGTTPLSPATPTSAVHAGRHRLSSTRRGARCRRRTSPVHDQPVQTPRDDEPAPPHREPVLERTKAPWSGGRCQFFPTAGLLTVPSRIGHARVPRPATASARRTRLAIVLASLAIDPLEGRPRLGVARPACALTATGRPTRRSGCTPVRDRRCRRRSAPRARGRSRSTPLARNPRSPRR